MAWWSRSEGSRSTEPATKPEHRRPSEQGGRIEQVDDTRQADGNPQTDHAPQTEPPTDAADTEETTVSDFNKAMQDCMSIEGALGAALVDQQSGMALATAGSPASVNLEVAAAGNSSVVQAKLRTIADLGLDDAIEDILITLGRQYHIIRPISSREGRGLFLYLVLDKNRANLAMARFRLTKIEQDFRL